MRNTGGYNRITALLTVLCMLCALTVPMHAVDERAESPGSMTASPESSDRETAEKAGEESAEAPETEPAEAPETEPAEAPETEPAEAPETEPAEAPETEPAEAPETEPAETPEAQPAEAPEAETTETPEAQPAEAPEAETTETPEAQPEEETSPIPAEGEILDTRISTIPLPECAPYLFDGALSERPVMTLSEALQKLTAELTERIRLAAEGADATEITLYYWNGSALAAGENLACIAAAFASRMGEVGWDADKPLTDRECEVLHTIFLAMTEAELTLTETDLSLGETDGFGEILCRTEKALDIKVAVYREMPPSLRFAESERALFEQNVTGEAWESLCALAAGAGQLPELPTETETDLRSRVADTALSLVGRVSYEYGGKYDKPGWCPSWGLPTVVKGNVIRRGLDCSGFVTWVFVNAAGTDKTVSLLGSGTSGMEARCESIEKEEVRPGDLAYCENHIGIVTGLDADGEPLVCHCSGEGVQLQRMEETRLVRFLRPAAIYGTEENVNDGGEAEAEQPEEAGENTEEGGKAALPEVGMQCYFTAGDQTVTLLTVSAQPEDGYAWCWDGTPLFYSARYDAWCTLTETGADLLTPDGHLTREACAPGETVLFDGDVNGSGAVDINDAQTAYLLSLGRFAFRGEDAPIWLRADMSGDGTLSGEDARLIFLLI